MLFGIQSLEIYRALPVGDLRSVFGKQLIKCASSVGANYRAACRAKSRPDFISKLKIVEEEADESLYWLEFMVTAEVIVEERAAALRREGAEILAIIVASIQTAKAKVASPKS